MVRIQIITDRRMNAGRADAPVANGLNLSLHLIHIAGWPAQVTDVPLKVRHLGDLLHLFHDRGFGPAGDHLALMRGDGAEAASAKTTPMHVDRVFYHFHALSWRTLLLGWKFASSFKDFAMTS